MQDADQGTLVAVIRATVDDKGEEFVCQSVFIAKKLKEIRHLS